MLIFFAQIFLILYSWSWNSITGKAILGNLDNFGLLVNFIIQEFEFYSIAELFRVNFSHERKSERIEGIYFSQKLNLDGLKNPIPLSFVPKNEQPPTQPHFPRASLHLTLLLTYDLGQRNHNLMVFLSCLHKKSCWDWCELVSAFECPDWDPSM